jgi:hypothetical protein
MTRLMDIYKQSSYSFATVTWPVCFGQVLMRRILKVKDSRCRIPVYFCQCYLL